MAAKFNPKAQLRIQEECSKIENRSQRLNLNWFRRNYERVYLNPSLPEDKIPKNAAILFNEMLRLEKEAAKARELRLELKKVTEPLEEEEEKKEPSIAELLAKGPMYPVPEELKNVLYYGISHNDEGRKRYLKLRNKKGVMLEEKFYKPLTTSHVYGWDVQARFIPTTRYGRKYVIKQSFLRSGVLKFDSHLWRGPQSDSAKISLD